MISRRLAVCGVVCLFVQIGAVEARAQGLGAAAAAAAKQREVSKDKPPTPVQIAAPVEPATAAADAKPAAEPKAAAEPAKPRTAELKKIDERYDSLLARMQALDVKMKKDVQAAKNAEMEFKIFRLDMANRNKWEKRQALEAEMVKQRAVVQENLVTLEKLRAEHRALEAELDRQ